MKKRKIACIIDDDKMFTYILAKQVKGKDLFTDLLVFHNGQEALSFLTPNAAFPENLPDIILLDISMPVMDGWQFLDEFIKFKADKKITVYIVSSSVNINDQEKALSYGIVANFYVRPVSQDALSQILEEIMD
jgi:CheY-like chemotaxis protein